MAYANSNRILTIASFGGTGSSLTETFNVTIFSPVQPTARDNGGDLINGDRWVDTSNLTESIYYYEQWLTIHNLTLEGIVDGGNSGPEGINPLIIDGGSSLPHPPDVQILDGGNSLNN